VRACSSINDGTWDGIIYTYVVAVHCHSKSGLSIHSKMHKTPHNLVDLRAFKIRSLSLREDLILGAFDKYTENNGGNEPWSCSCSCDCSGEPLGCIKCGEFLD